MKKALLLVILLFVPILSFAGEWSDIRQTGFGNTINFTSEEYKISISWPNNVVAGEAFLFTVEDYKDMKIKRYRHYSFDGIEDHSLRIGVRGADSTPRSPSGKDDPNVADTYYIERFSDGSFYFVTMEMKGKASLKITASKEYPGTYDVQLLRAE